MSCIDHNLDAMGPRCVLCDRTFESDDALGSTNETHPRMPSAVQLAIAISAATRPWDSTCGTPPFMLCIDCDDCDRSFDSEKALQQHLRDSPAHGRSFDCKECDRSFGCNEALQQHHLRDSPVHAPSFEYGFIFCSDDVLEQHL